jgi:hypothetical protein
VLIVNVRDVLQNMIKGTRGQKDITRGRRAVGGEQAGRWAGGRAGRRAGGQADRRTGGQADRRTGGQAG